MCYCLSFDTKCCVTVISLVTHFSICYMIVLLKVCFVVVYTENHTQWIEGTHRLKVGYVLSYNFNGLLLVDLFRQECTFLCSTTKATTSWKQAPIPTSRCPCTQSEIFADLCYAHFLSLKIEYSNPFKICFYFTWSWLLQQSFCPTSTNTWLLTC